MPSGLDRVLPAPRLVETDAVDLDLAPERAWDLLRHGDLGRSRLVHALFALRTLPGRLAGGNGEDVVLRLDDLVSTPARPGFAILVDDAPREVVVGAIGKVWHLDIPFLHTPTPEAYAAFAAPGYVKVAWAIQVQPRGATGARVTIEVRVTATDEPSWRKFRRYFRLIGPVSRFIRRSQLGALAREHGSPEAREAERPLPGDDLLPDAAGQVTQGITVAAPPEAIWPWLVQMGRGRAGFYSVDVLDNGGRRSAREIHPDLQDLSVGEILPAGPDPAAGGFEVLRLEPERVLVLGILVDAHARAQVPFAAPRPPAFWQASWAFVLEPLDPARTRLHVRARAAYSPGERLHASWIVPVHHFMEAAQLRNIAARAEGRLPASDWRDVASGIGGAALMLAGLLTPFRHAARCRWGVDAATAARAYPGDHLVPEPRWSWTHGIEIEAPATEVWAWIAQIGADRAGFYSYQWLENLAGCGIRNAETLHPEWALGTGDRLRLHPDVPLTVDACAPGRYFVAAAPGASWLFLVEPRDGGRSRLISRFRCASPPSRAQRVALGPALLEPIGFAMDRRMLLGIKERAEGGVRRTA